MILFTTFAVYLLVLLGESEGKQVSNLKKPTKLGSCKAQLDDGRIFDLSSLDKASKPRSIDFKWPSDFEFFIYSHFIFQNCKWRRL